MQIYKYCVHNVAHSYGKTATFMPKPIYGDNGSGMHVHQSIWKGGKPLFAGNGYADLSETALYYIGGIIKHAKAMNAFTNPTTNSYKRLIPGFEAPVLLAYSARNRSASCRIPYRRQPEGQARRGALPRSRPPTPYLGFAAMLMAGLDGIQNKIHPGDPMDKDLYDLPPEELKDIPTVCGSLREAIGALEADHDFLLAGDVFSTDQIESYIELKWERGVSLSSTRRTRSSSRCTTRSEARGTDAKGRAFARPFFAMSRQAEALAPLRGLDPPQDRVAQKPADGLVFPRAAEGRRGRVGRVVVCACGSDRWVMTVAESVVGRPRPSRPCAYSRSRGSCHRLTAGVAGHRDLRSRQRHSDRIPRSAGFASRRDRCSSTK